MNAAELKARIDDRIKTLAAETDKARFNVYMIHYFATCAKFHHYSPYNQLLIMMQAPEATRVAGYTTWLKLHRFVRKGEHGIPILAPVIGKKEPDNPDSKMVVKCFKVTYVFDISQTDGEPLPEPPNWKSPERMHELETRLIEYAGTQGISVDRTDKIRKSAQGASSKTNITLAPDAGTKTLIHELAHILLRHHGDLSVSPQAGEIEAESVAYVVASHFGIEDLASPNYLTLWNADSDKIIQRLDRIRKTASQIITAIEPKTGPGVT